MGLTSDGRSAARPEAGSDVCCALDPPSSLPPPAALARRRRRRRSAPGWRQCWPRNFPRVSGHHPHQQSKAGRWAAVHVWQVISANMQPKPLQGRVDPGNIDRRSKEPVRKLWSSRSTVRRDRPGTARLFARDDSSVPDTDGCEVAGDRTTPWTGWRRPGRPAMRLLEGERRKTEEAGVGSRDRRGGNAKIA